MLPHHEGLALDHGILGGLGLGLGREGIMLGVTAPPRDALGKPADEGMGANLLMYSKVEDRSGESSY